MLVTKIFYENSGAGGFVVVVVIVLSVAVGLASWYESCGWSRARSCGRSLVAGCVAPSLLWWLASCTRVGGIRG